jgi:hypothetical protein
MSPDPRAQRMRRLERDLRHTRIFAVCGLLMSGIPAVSGFQRRTDPVVRAERLELLAQPGARRAILTADTLGFAVTLLDKNGRPAGGLVLRDEPRVAVVTGQGREVASLGEPKLIHPLTE